MSFLEKNGFRAALAIAVVFLIIPFMFPERVPVHSDGDSSFASENKGASKSFLKNIYDRVGSFYGFKKKKNFTLSQTLANLKKEAEKSKADAKTSAAAAATSNSFEKSSAESPAASSNSTLAEGSSFEPSSSKSSVKASFAAGSNSKPVLSMHGKNYEVLKDPFGEDYAITEKGPVSVKSLVKDGGIFYPTGKNAARTGVSAQAGATAKYGTNASGYKSSSSFSYKSKGSKGGVASTRKLSSGFSLSGGGIASKSKHGGSGGSGGAVHFDNSYAAVQNKVAEIAKTNTKTNAMGEYTVYDYAPASSSAAVSAFPNVDPKLLGESAIGQNPQSVSITEAVPPQKQAAPAHQTTTAAAPVSLDLQLEAPSLKDVAKKEEDTNKTEVYVKVDPGNDGVIPEGDNMRQKMTDLLLGEGAVFNGTLGKTPKKNPWVVPTTKNVKVAPGYAFWEANKAALIAGNSPYQDPKVWASSDSTKSNVNKTIENIKKDNIEIIVIDGNLLGNKKNYFLQAASGIIDSKKNAPNKIYIVDSEATKKDIEAKNKGARGVVYEDFAIAPGENTKYFEKIAEAVKKIDEDNRNQALAEEQSRKLDVKTSVENLSNGTTTAPKATSVAINVDGSKRPI